MQTEHLLTLATVARTGSLSRAARLLGKTQPAISTQIKLLGDYVGEAVVTRHRHGVRLTPGGEALLPAAQEVARAVDNAEQIVKRLQGNEISPLRIASATSIAVYLLPQALARYRERYPKTDVRLDRTSAPEAIRSLEQNDSDLALIRGPLDHMPKGAACLELAGDETVLTVRPDHALANRKQIRLKDVDGLEIVSQGADSATQAMVERLAAAAGIAFRLKFVAPGVDAVKEAVFQGFGAGFLSQLAIAREVADGRLKAIRIADADLRRPVILLHTQSALLSPRLKGFLDVLDEVKLGAR
jgi:DNA-binding transcriptional LysR family regulator